ncbi:spore coat protein [Dendrosporobacter sp. 1207_IL3150]|uniref:spore coat protein n=1 Tax=Dendrosporobacter sp. 1207_IL3150 TaxID=3084054 RepID=UPI002FD9CACE
MRNMRSSQNRLSDRDMLLDLLNTEKSMSHMYDHAIMESSNENVRYAFEEFQHDEHENGHLIFKSMQERGWYNSTTDVRMPKSNYINAGRSNRNAATSDYAVTSGSEQFGSRLSRGSNRRVTNNSFV